MAHLGVCRPSMSYIFHDVCFRGPHGIHGGHSKGWLLMPGVAGNRAAEHCSDPSAGLSPFADTDGVVTGATNLACYMQDPDFGYQDFARRDEDQTQVFRVQVRLLLSWWQQPKLLPPLPSPACSSWAVNSGRVAHSDWPCPTRVGKREVTSVPKG